MSYGWSALIGKYRRSTSVFFKGKDIGHYRLSQVSPGVDSIIESIISEQPDFNSAEFLMASIEDKVIEFILNIRGFFSDAR